MATTGFLELQLDPQVSYGSKGGNVYPVVVVTNPSHLETRYPQASRGYYMGSIDFKGKTVSEMRAIRAHWNAVGGKLYGWRYRNPQEYFTSTDNGVSGQIIPEPITTYAGGTTMQLIHTRLYGGQSQIVIVKKPDMVEPITLFRGSDSTVYDPANWALDTTTGIVTFTTDQTGHTFWWAGKWDTPARFDDDNMETERVDFDEDIWESIKIVEIQVI